MIQDKKWSILIVLLFFVWGGISYHWYTCGIKGFCVEKKVAMAPETCGEYLTQHIKLGAVNDTAEVRKLEEFLAQYEGADLLIDGVYSTTDEAIIKNFQEKYRADILDPWGMSEPSGFVYKTTRTKVNELYCAARNIK